MFSIDIKNRVTCFATGIAAAATLSKRFNRVFVGDAETTIIDTDVPEAGVLVAIALLYSSSPMSPSSTRCSRKLSFLAVPCARKKSRPQCKPKPQASKELCLQKTNKQTRTYFAEFHADVTVAARRRRRRRRSGGRSLDDVRLGGDRRRAVAARRRHAAHAAAKALHLAGVLRRLTNLLLLSLRLGFDVGHFVLKPADSQRGTTKKQQQQKQPTNHHKLKTNKRQRTNERTF
jgi:hypothetical protein